MLTHLKNITQRRKKNVLRMQHILAIKDYFSNFSTSCDFPEVPDEVWNLDDHRPIFSFKQQLRELFVVPRLKDQSQNHSYKCQLIEAFLCFLLQLLYHLQKDPKIKWAENLEQELRCLFTILGDISWMLHDCDEMQRSDEFHNLMAKFEFTANQAGYFLHSKLMGTDVGFHEMDDWLSAVLHSVGLLKACIHSSDIIATPLCTSTPKTSFINSFLFLDSLVNDLQDLLKRKDNPISDVKDQTILLHQGLQCLHSSIKDMRSPQPSEIGELRELVMHIGDIADQAQYLINAFLVKDVPLWYVITRLTYLNHKIEDIRKELQVVTEKYKFGGLKLTEYHSTQIKVESDGIMVGFEDEARAILDELDGGTRGLLVVSIIGMPGLGKTTLAKKLFNHPLLRYKFDKFSWCVISQAYERRTILADILIHINNDFGKDQILKMEEETLGEHIYKTLKGRRYIVAMDDVWDSDVLYELRRFFPDEGNGSRMLVTSRIKDVAPPDSIIHELPFLSNEQCWELLQKKVFSSRTCPPQLHPIGKQIAEKCRGLPLTVSVLAGILSTMDEEESSWEEVLGNLASYVKDSEENTVMQILQLSYKHLPDHLKPCFLFFGAYEEDQKIPVGNLKRFWVAEGFIRRENEKSEECVAEEYMMELINRSLVMVAERKIDGRVKACVVHDLLRDLCLKISQEEGFLQFWNNESYAIFEKCYRLRVLGDCKTLRHCQHIRSFYGESEFSDLHVRDMKLLRVMHCISEWYIVPYFFGLEYLVNLRFLVTGEETIRWLEKLVNLEYLHVHSRICITPEILKMNKLRYIHANDIFYSEDLSSCSESNSLEYLSCLKIRKAKDEEILKCSPHLRKLRCRYLTMKSPHPHFDLRFLTQLDSLYLEFSADNKFKLEEIGFPSNIRKLSLEHTILSSETMSIIGRLEKIEVLILVFSSFVGERWDTREGEFLKLRFLEMHGVKQLSQWNVSSNDHFPKLQQLVLINCSELEEICSEIGEIMSLELITVKGRCLDSLVESVERIKIEQEDMGNEGLTVVINLW